MIEIISNGSKWAGEPPDPIEHLFEALRTETLDPVFENYGGFFWYDRETGLATAWGNFLAVSHVFQIEGTLAEMRPLALALKVARHRPEYLHARERAMAKL